jgi:hypothetical protein
MIEHVLRYTLPAAYAVLPAAMASPEASALLLAIGLQESQFLERRQGDGGPARGFWQFEEIGIRGVLEHSAATRPIGTALAELRYPGPPLAHGCWQRVEHNDVLAAAFARCLLWTLPGRLARQDEPQRAWNLYIDGWRPGKPRPQTWDAYYDEAWDRVRLVWPVT